MQTITLEDLPGHTMTVDVAGGYLTAVIRTGEDVQVCSAQWQIGDG